MGLLSKGQPLSWEETKKHARHVQKAGIKQFISLYHRLKDRTNDELKFGDEIEYTLVKVDRENKTAKLSLMGPQILDELQKPELDEPDDHETKWRPEYASYMIEGEQITLISTCNAVPWTVLECAHCVYCMLLSCSQRVPFSLATL
jgi:glutamate--cysteine ligase catalytic subunit